MIDEYCTTRLKIYFWTYWQVVMLKFTNILSHKFTNILSHKYTHFEEVTLKLLNTIKSDI